MTTPARPVLSLGNEGHDVGLLHQLLIEAGFEIAHDEATAEAFGPTTQMAVRAVQVDHGLAIDGIAGPRTWRALGSSSRAGFTAPAFRCELELARPAVRPVLTRALGELGVQETGNNEGPILKYGGNPGEPWCLYFVSWCYAGGPFGVLASAYKMINWGAEHGRLVSPSTPLEPGDILLFMRTKFRGHGAIAASTEHEGNVSTVGGNESGAVRGNVRRRASATAIVRPIS